LSGDVEQALRDLLRSADKGIIERTAADILKALLLLYGSAWEGDLMDTLAGLWSVRGMGLEEMGEAEAAIPEAEKLLVEKGLIRVEKRYRADLGESGPILEKFILTNHLLLLMRVFSGDVELDRFRHQMMQG
jgi:hypothetical protein